MTVIKPKIALVMPRNMCFSPKGATSIDLCVHDYVAASKYRDAITVYAMPATDPYTDMSVKFFNDLPDLLAQLDRDQPDLIFSQQHLPTATKLAARYKRTPILMQAHNFQKAPKNAFKRWYKTRAYRKLAGLIMVSNALVKYFRTTYPKLSLPLFCGPNGLDLSEWNPQTERMQEILYVGRLTQEKGVFELAEAVARVLPTAPGWCARFIVSTHDGHAGVRERLDAILAPVAGRVTMATNCPFTEVRQAMEHAAIAVVPSIYWEAFGRTAIEAFAGGAALIASTRGGLGEVIADAAIRLEGEITPETIMPALQELIQNPDRRAALAKAGQARVVANYTIAHNAAAIDAAIDDVMARRKK